MNPVDRFPSQKAPCWRKVPKDGYHRAEAFLRVRERFCVSASSRFLGMDSSRGHIWYLDSPPGKVPAGEVSALLIHSRRSLFPVFGGDPCVPGPRFLNRFLGKARIHALQGLRGDVETLGSLMETQGYFVSEKIEYDLMGLDGPPQAVRFPAGPPGLTLRPPFPEDVEALSALQAAYEQEEVLPAGAVFDPAVSRYNLAGILSNEQVLLAELDGMIVGKINTSAMSFTRYQIGGVYIHPSCRGMGIGSRMTAVFVRNLLAQGRGITLFVKKRNAAARKVYRKVGFSVLGDYRISYF